MGGRNSDRIETEGSNAITGAVTDPVTTGTGGRRPGRSGGRTGGRTETESVVLEKHLVNTPKPVTVDVPGKDKAASVDKEEEKKAKQRERQRKYREQKKTQSTGKTTTAKKTSSPKADATQLKFLLLTISNVMATRPGMEMWKLTPQEVDSIAEPLSNMMAKNDAVATALEEHGDALALITAVAMIAFPRVMMMMAQRKAQPAQVSHPAAQTQEVKNNASRNGTPAESPDAKGKDGGSSQPARNVTTDSRAVHGGTLHSIVPAIGYGY